jgi:hypothetical protein
LGVRLALAVRSEEVAGGSVGLGDTLTLAARLNSTEDPDDTGVLAVRFYLHVRYIGHLIADVNH